MDEFTVQYGSFVCGGTTSYELDKVYTLVEDFETGSFEFTLCVAEASEAAFAASCQAVEAAFRKPRQDLIVTLGATQLLARTHSQTTQTALDTFPRITKIEEGASGRSRKYTVRVEYGMPADNIGTFGRRSSQMRVERSPARRYEVTFTGTYTATAGESASDNYLTNIDIFCNSRLLAAFGLEVGTTIELVSEEYAPNETDKVVTFRRVYRECLFPQSPSVAAPRDTARVVDQSFNISFADTAPGDAPVQVIEGALSSAHGRARRWRKVTATYSAHLHSAVTVNPDAEWNQFILPWIVKQMRRLLPVAGHLVITDQERTPTYDANLIQGTVSGWVVASDFSEAYVSIEDRIESGEQLVGAWTKDPYSYYQFTGPAVWQRTVSEKYVRLQADFPIEPADPPEGFSYIKTPIITKRAPKDLGLVGFGAESLRVYELERVTVWQFYRPIPQMKKPDSGSPTLSRVNLTPIGSGGQPRTNFP